MWGEAWGYIAEWSPLDTWIVVTGMLAAMACSLPGCFLVLRRQSMMGDALSHTSLLGVIVAYLAAHGLRAAGVIDAGSYALWQHAFMFAGAMAIGVLAAVLTEWIQHLGRVEASAALGVVFTVFFAIGLLLVRLTADRVDLDPGCVLYGAVETTYVGVGVPAAAVANGLVLVMNLVLVVAFFKELRVCAFDPGLATSQGINSRVVHYVLMAVTAGTVVAAFDSVGVILVIAMLIAPPATAHLLTDRLWKMIVISLGVAMGSAVLGHVMAITLPPIVFSRLGFPEVRAASTAGMMAVASGLLFSLAVVFAPRHGLLSKAIDQARLGMRIASEDLLGLLFRLEEQGLEGSRKLARTLMRRTLGMSRVTSWLAMRRLTWQGRIVMEAEGYHLTDRGRRKAERLVRSHRLWESYLSKHFVLPDDHLHHSAMRAEHFIDEDVRRELSRELDEPATDPHGQAIPPEIVNTGPPAEHELPGEPRTPVGKESPRDDQQ